ncbi:MAG TPA: hypothetical protein VF808_12265 [Ktedonobacterales bacterium]
MDDITVQDDLQSPVLLHPATEQAWLASRLLHRQVVDASSIEPVGRVADLIFDPIAGQVMGLVVAPAEESRGLFARLFKRRRAGGTIGLDHVISMDGDVVMLNADPFKSTAPRELERMPHLNVICEMAILTMRGSCLGSLADLVLEDRGTRVTGYVVTPTALGEQTLPMIDDVAPDALAGVEPAANGRSPAPRMRVIPVSGNVRIGDSLILLVAEVTPLHEDVVIVSQDESQPDFDQN